MAEVELLERITSDPKIFGGKPILRGRRIAVEHILGMLAAGDSIENILAGYPFLEKKEIQIFRLASSTRAELLRTSGLNRSALR